MDTATSHEDHLPHERSHKNEGVIKTELFLPSETSPERELGQQLSSCSSGVLSGASSGSVDEERQTATAFGVIEYSIPPPSSFVPEEERLKLFVCDKCPEKFTSEEFLERHQLSHEEPHGCGTCGKVLPRGITLEVHQRSHCRPKAFECYLCFKSFIQKASLENHLAIHAGEKTYSCEVCNKKFPYLCALRVHRRVHKTEKPHVCDVCQKRFVIACHLHVHARTHTGDRPFTCEFCGKQFSQLGTLKRHHRTHTGEKPYVCHVCQRPFSLLETLQRHLRERNGGRPVCGQETSRASKKQQQKSDAKTCPKAKSFSRSRVFVNFATQDFKIQKRYLRTNAGEKQFVCEFCNSRFALTATLKRHLRTHKGDNKLKSL